MQFCVHVLCPPYSQQSNLSALSFCQAVVASEHELVRVFFSGDGVWSGNDLMVPPQDELNLVAAWQALAQSANVELVVCVSAALRRGLLDASEADRYAKQHHNLADPFVISGLGQLVDACLQVDRVVTFGSH